MKFPLISCIRSLKSKLSTCDRTDLDLSLDMEEAQQLLTQLEPVLARIEVANFREKKKYGV